jgi:hypothetical protein
MVVFFLGDRLHSWVFVRKDDFLNVMGLGLGMSFGVVGL